MKTRVLPALAALALVAAAPAPIDGTYGNIRDGDTFSVCAGGKCTWIRVCGIDARPQGEGDWLEATVALRDAARAGAIHCLPVGAGTPCDGRSPRRSHSRVVAQCFVNGRDLAAVVARKGLACDWPRYSGGYYARIVGAATCAVH